MATTHTQAGFYPLREMKKEPQARVFDSEVRSEVRHTKFHLDRPRLGGAHTMIAGILAGYYPEPVKISILATLCGLTMGGSFSARLSEVRAAGLLEDPARGYVKATELCAREYLGKFQVPSNTQEVIAMWEPKWGKVHRDIMQFLVSQGGDAVSKEQLAEAVGLTMGGSFSARLSEVRSSGLLSEPGRGLVAANKKALFLDGDSPRAREA